jgi:nicotinamidase-related amidase
MSGSHVPPFVTQWFETIKPTDFASLGVEPESIGFFSADLINGFVHEGPLASERVRAIAKPVASTFERGWNHGIREFVLMQDTHSPHTPEFRSYPPHCLAGTSESQTIPELANLPFADSFTIIEKNSIDHAIGTGFSQWLDDHAHITMGIVVGDCSDLCTYNLAMHLRMRANAFNLGDFRVVVPVDCVDTFDIPWSEDSRPGAAHPGQFFHEVFLYHMAQNGIEVVTRIDG